MIIRELNKRVIEVEGNESTTQKFNELDEKDEMIHVFFY